MTYEDFIDGLIEGRCDGEPAVRLRHALLWDDGSDGRPLLDAACVDQLDCVLWGISAKLIDEQRAHVHMLVRWCIDQLATGELDFGLPIVRDLIRHKVFGRDLALLMIEAVLRQVAEHGDDHDKYRVAAGCMGCWYMNRARDATLARTFFEDDERRVEPFMLTLRRALEAEA